MTLWLNQLTSKTRTILYTTCTALYTINVFFNWNGFLFFIHFGPAYRQKYRYVANIVRSGVGDPDKSHVFVRRSVIKKDAWNNQNFVFIKVSLTLMLHEKIHKTINKCVCFSHI